MWNIQVRDTTFRHPSPFRIAKVSSPTKAQNSSRISSKLQQAEVGRGLCLARTLQQFSPSLLQACVILALGLRQRHSQSATGATSQHPPVITRPAAFCTFPPSPRCSFSSSAQAFFHRCTTRSSPVCFLFSYPYSAYFSVFSPSSTIATTTTASRPLYTTSFPPLSVEQIWHCSAETP